jgi:hypothetical protein
VVVQRLIELADEHVRGGRTPRYYEQPELEAMGIGELDAVYVDAAREVQVLSGTHGDDLRHGFVQSGIDEKNEKVAAYRENMSGAKEQWLLVLAGIRGASGVWHVVIKDHVYVSTFDRTFCLDAYDDVAFEVRTVPPPEK